MEPVDDEAPKDPGARQYAHQGYTEQDFEGHRAHTVFVGVHLPARGGRGRRHSHRRHKEHHRRDVGEKGVVDRPVTPPSQRVQFILGEDIDDGGTHESHPLFSEMEELVRGEGDEIEWKETARWVKFEEDVEQGGNRWSKPHVATLSLHSLFELRSLLLNGTVMLDMEATNLDQVADLVCDNMINAGSLSHESREKVREALLRRHRHQHERDPKKKDNMSRLPIIRSLTEIGRNHSTSKNLQASNSEHSSVLLSVPSPREYRAKSDSELNPKTSSGYLSIPTGEEMVKSPSNISMQHNGNGGDHSDHKANTQFMRKIPPGSEASNILVGEVDFLDKTLSAFIRLSQATIMGDLTEVPVPTRFMFILLGPPGSQEKFHEIGRAMATLMSDEVFHEVAYRARKRDHLLAGIDEFLDAVTVLPPGEWDPTIRIEPPAAIPSQDTRKRPPAEKPPKEKEEHDEQEEEARLREESGLSRTGRLFGGLINDFKRKTPFYVSDFKDALALKCISTWIFLYFACLSPIITFGGLLGEATGKNMAAMESLVSGFVCGIGYAFFSGQPLTILGSTGPVLVFETIVYEFSKAVEWDYMSFRLWIGTWTALILLILVAVDASAFVCYITRFTEENFACLIAFIFIFKAVENVLSIGRRFPMHPPEVYDCVCTPPLGSNDHMLNWTKFSRKMCVSLNGTLIGDDCLKPDHTNANVFPMSFILFMGTFLLSIILKDFKNALFFPSKIRHVISDFAVLIAIFSMTLTDLLFGIPTPKLEVPTELKPTLDTRGWFIFPFNGNPVWSSVVAILPALLGTILIFMDQQITAVIVNRKEHKLKKGCGYHLDLFVLAILIQICSLMGLPWFVAATVLSINHVNSLKVEPECSIPGVRSAGHLGVLEQRGTHLLIFLTIGISVLLTPLLSHIPMPVLFGVFLYMGVSSLKGLQFFDRILIMLMPVKYQPDYMFLRQVPLRRVHLFTCIQLTCLAVLWLIKSFRYTSILFPLMLVVMIGVRKALDCIFTRRELKILDDIMPEITKRAAADDLHHLEDGNGAGEENITPHDYSDPNIQIPLANGNIMKIPISSINISEEVSKTSIWKQVNDGTRSLIPSKKFISLGLSDKKHKGIIRDLSPKGEKRLSTMAEEDELKRAHSKEIWTECKASERMEDSTPETTV
ncbi:sodium bicarbonate cotransporter 3 isoform X4 [Phlebotomus argentipes]|nr:sodium bicarbonate cotransporter 3 isoform X4 [Phlebotomus argentipes]XP_059617091.1 sodium bicarbonate cotransporter 3 isoform X4 [Phlebotomus argentipes]XP_059617097.1 sodium bicarbonate cotransporter 3 isoform X4 [Phlebotomus argentipes]